MNQLSFKLKGVKKEKPPKEFLIHREIKARCKALGYICFMSPMWRKTGRGVGEPDATIYIPGGKPLLIEAKRQGCKLTEEQELIKKKLHDFGYVVYTVENEQQLDFAFKHAAMRYENK